MVRHSGSEGLALPLLLLLLMALSAFGHSVLLLSRRELQATWAYRHLARAEAAAEIGLRLAWAIPLDSRTLRVPWVEEVLVHGETEDGLLYRGTRRWLNSEFFLVEGIGRSRGWEGEQRTAWVGWTRAPTIRVRAFLTAIEPGTAIGVTPDPQTHGPGERGETARPARLGGTGPPLPRPGRRRYDPP